MGLVVLPVVIDVVSVNDLVIGIDNVIVRVTVFDIVVAVVLVSVSRL